MQHGKSLPEKRDSWLAGAWEFFEALRPVLAVLPFVGKYFRDTRVKRYIKPKYTIETFFEELNRREVQYVVLRWFEELPRIEPGEDIDLLLKGEDLGKVRDLFWPFKDGIQVDLYTDDGRCNYNGAFYYPPVVSQEILENRVAGKAGAFRPDSMRYFLSLSYHAVYHKHEKSGLPYRGSVFFENATSPEHPYQEILGRLARENNVQVEITLENLDSLLREKQWAPGPDLLRKLSSSFPGSRWLKLLCRIAESRLEEGDENIESPVEKLLKETFLKELHLGSNHPGLTEALDRLAAEYRRRGKEREAKQLSRRVLKIWEEAFVPEYGWRHLLSDLFGGELTRVRPPLKFKEETVLQLTPDHLLGTGDNRSCYAYPGDPSRCIKVDKPWNEGFHNTPRKRVKKALMPWLADFSSNREEARFYRTKALELGEEFYRFAPRCYGIVLTNLGPGLVFERIRNSDGSYAQPLGVFLRRFPEQARSLANLVDCFVADLRRKRLSLFIWDERNLYVRCDDQQRADHLVAIDWKSEGRPNNDLPLTSIFPALAAWKMEKEARNLIKRILTVWSGREHGASADALIVPEGVHSNL